MMGAYKELVDKRDLCLKAADECSSVKMWSIWVRKANYLRQKAMASLENDMEKYYTGSTLTVNLHAYYDREKMIETVLDKFIKLFTK